MSGRLSIGIVCFPTVGGSGIVASEIAAGMVRREHRVHVIASAPPSRGLPTYEGLFFHKVTVSDYPLFQHPPYTLSVASTIIDVARAYSLDVVHTHYAIPHAASAYLACQVLGASAPRFITTLHGTDVTQVGGDPSYQSVCRFTVAHSDGITVPSAFLRREACHSIGLSEAIPIEVIPNFVDTNLFAPAEKIDQTPFDTLFGKRGADCGPVLFHVSNFRPVKRVLDLIDVLARVREHVPARLILVGDGPDRPKAAAKAEELRVADCVCFLGQRLDFAEYLKHVDVFVLASENESFGVAALEALSAGIPVVAYRVGGLPEVVTSDVGMLVDPLDIDALAHAVLDIVTNSQKRKAFADAARARALANYQREPALDRYESYYRRVIADAR